MEANFVINSFRSITAIIDKGIYNLISLLYELLMTIVSTPIFSDEKISGFQDFSRRIYVFIGVIMVFKVTFSLISYLVNPDSINDKTNGAGNMAKNIVVTLFLIIIVPYAFDFLFVAQDAILEDNIISKLILGTENGELSGLKLNMNKEVCNDSSIVTANPGQYMALATLRPFYQPYKNGDEYPIMKNTEVKDKYCTSLTINDMLSSDIYKADEGSSDQNNIGKYLIDYSSILSTAVGVIILLLLLTNCMEIALRTIKLGFLELIAPVPIISYVDPKSGKDGMFKKWLNEVISTWTSLFIRLATLYFAIYVIDVVNQTIDATDAGIWVILFLIIGAMMFVKQAPKLISDIFGFKIDELSLHPIKKIQDQAAGGKQLVGAAGAVGSAALSGVGSAISHGIARYNKFKKIDELYHGNELQPGIPDFKDKIDESNRKIIDLRSKNHLAFLNKQSELAGIDSKKSAVMAQRDSALAGIEAKKKQNYHDYLFAKTEADKKAALANADKLREQEKAVKQKFGLQVDALDLDAKKVNDKFMAENAKYNAAINAEKANQAQHNASIKSIEEEIAKEKDSRLYQKPVSGYAEEIFHGMTNGAKTGYKQPTKPLSNALSSVEQASTMRNYREKYSLSDQIKDKFTDVVGIKNESGTTHLAGKELKKLEDKLAEITRQLEMSRNSLGSLQKDMGANFERAVLRDNSTGRMTFNATYTGPYADDIKAILNGYNQNVDAYNRTKKEIKEQQDIQKAAEQGKKGK